MPLESEEIRKMFLKFFEEKDHKILPSASIVPENDPSVLYTTAGMQPLVPYLMGEKHPLGKRLANVQKCIRLQDIEEVGDTNHDTFFEMLGNWSLGDYFKKESIEWSWEFLTSKEWLNIPPEKIYVTVFKGDKETACDEESIKSWKEVFSKAGINAKVYGKEEPEKDSSYRIFMLNKDENWWPAGGKQPGPQGPDTEIFYYWGEKEPDLKKERPGFNDDNFWEIWNNVFMEYNREGNEYSKLKQKNVDTGMGLERACAVMQGKQDIFLTDLFTPVIRVIEEESGVKYGEDEKKTLAMRIIADHLKTAVFILGDDAKIAPSNVDRGYVLRRLIRRAVRYQKVLGIEGDLSQQTAEAVINKYGSVYNELNRNKEFILEEIKKEEEKFSNALSRGLKEWEKVAEDGKITGEEAFNLFSTYGFPFELTQELAEEKGVKVNEKEFSDAFEKHQEMSRKGAEKKFKGGLGDTSENTVKLHTATHLLQFALRKVLGSHVEQKGSNITPERLRFDFSHPDKLTDEEIKKVEEIVNGIIDKEIEVVCKEDSYDKAIEEGALGFFGERYGGKVKVYAMGESKEICNGPHVKNTGELGKFHILKEESSSSGIRRIKAALE